MSTDTLRAAFEAYFADSRRGKGASKAPTFARLADGTYADDPTQRHWWTWQQARAALAPHAAPAQTAGGGDAVADAVEHYGGVFSDAQLFGTTPPAASGEAVADGEWPPLPAPMADYPEAGQAVFDADAVRAYGLACRAVPQPPAAPAPAQRERADALLDGFDSRIETAEMNGDEYDAGYLKAMRSMFCELLADAGITAASAAPTKETP